MTANRPASALPDVLGIGVPKSATSWIARCLDEHPDICMYSGKEAHFFNNEEHYQKGLMWYRELFAACDRDALIGEFTPLYFSHEDAPARIAATVPDAKLLVCLRDPVQRALSNIEHLRSKGELSANASVEEAVRMHPHIITDGSYATHLRRYLTYFPREQIYVCFYDDISAAPIRSIQEIYAFLGVRPDHVPESAHARHNTTAARSSSLYWLANKLYMKLSRYRLGRSVIQFLKTLGVRSSHIETLAARKGGAAAQDISAADKRFLAAHYTGEIADLEALLDVSFSHWKTYA